MSNEFIDINVTGIANLTERLKKMPPAIQEKAVDNVTNYLLNVLIHKEIPPEKYVSRKTAYPETGNGFFTAKQRRYFFWAKRNGLINVPYKRRGATGGIASKWRIVKDDDGYKRIINTSPGAFYVYDDFGQARQLSIVGWKTIGTIITERRKNIRDIINRAARTALKKLGLIT